MEIIIVILVFIIIILCYFNYKKNVLLRQEKNVIIQRHISKLWSDVHYQIAASKDINYLIPNSILYRRKKILGNLPISWQRDIWKQTLVKLKEDKQVYDSESQYSVMLFEKVISQYQKYLKT